MSSRVALPVLMWSISASGAEESPEDPAVIELEVITVTATKSERSAFEVLASVSLIGPERIESEQPQSIGDLLEELPNVELLSGPRRIGETANIRSFDEERIVTTIDGARQNFNIGHQGRFFIEPDLLKQVEVYRGANSALYGSGAIAGVPDLKPETTCTLEAGLRTRFDDLLVEADRLRLQAAYFDTDARDFIDLEVDIVAGTTRPDNVQDAELDGFETEFGHDASRFFAAIGYSETRGRDATKSEPLTSVPLGKLVATLGLRLPELGLVFTGRGHFAKRQDEVPAGVPVTPGYGVCDLYASWLPEGAGYSGLRVDFGIDNLTDKSYRRHLSLIDEAGRNFKVSVSYRFLTGR